MNWPIRSTGYMTVFLAGILTGIVLAGRLAGDASPPPGAEARGETAVKSPGVTVPQPRLEFAGSGPADSDEFDLAQGPTRITVEYSGHSWFWVGLAEISGPARAVAGVPQARV